MTSAPQILSNVVADFLNEKQDQDGEKKQRQCALDVAFFNAEKIDEFQAMIAPIAPNLQKHGNRLISFYPTNDDAQKVANAISSILYSFDSALIEQDFTTDWLSEYFQLSHYGVNHAGARHELSSPSQISAYLAEYEKSSLKNKAYEAKESAAKSNAISYSNAQMTEDFAQFLYANWEGFNDMDRARQLMTDLIAIMEEETKDAYHFSKYPAQRTLMAMERKAEYLSSDINKTVDSVKKEYAIKEEFEKLARPNESNNRWKACAKQLESHINRNAPGITPKGLAVLLKDEDAEIGKHEAFTGLDLSYDNEVNINKRLSPRTLRYDIQEQSYRLPEQLAGAIAAYYLTVMQVKHETKFKELLIEHSKVMDKEPFFDRLLDLAAKSKPDYQATASKNVNAAAKVLVGEEGMLALKEAAGVGTEIEQELEVD